MSEQTGANELFKKSVPEPRRTDWGLSPTCRVGGAEQADGARVEWVFWGPPQNNPRLFENSEWKPVYKAKPVAVQSDYFRNKS